MKTLKEIKAFFPKKDWDFYIMVLGALAWCVCVVGSMIYFMVTGT